jgi:hypothetical protein
VLRQVRGHEPFVVVPNLTRRAQSACGLALLVSIASLIFWIAYPSTRASQTTSPVLSGDTFAEFVLIEPIDVHTHVSQTGPAFAAMLERLHLHILDILYVDDTTPERATLAPQKHDALEIVASSNGHAQLCTTFEPFRFNNASFAREVIAGLDEDFANGAVAVKIWKNVGMEIKNASGQYVMPDDPRFEPIYKDISTHHRTLITHLADPDIAWGVPDANPPHLGYYNTHPQWTMSGKPGAPEKQTILRARDHVLAMNPDLRVIGAHLGSMENQLDDLAVRLDRYPNFAVDTAARVRTLVLQPRDKVLAFILKYQDRILYGTDLHFSAGTVTVEAWEKQYALKDAKSKD